MGVVVTMSMFIRRRDPPAPFSPRGAFGRPFRGNDGGSQSVETDGFIYRNNEIAVLPVPSNQMGPTNQLGWTEYRGGGSSRIAVRNSEKGPLGGSDPPNMIGTFIRGPRLVVLSLKGQDENMDQPTELLRRWINSVDADTPAERRARMDGASARLAAREEEEKRRIVPPAERRAVDALWASIEESCREMNEIYRKAGGEEE